MTFLRSMSMFHYENQSRRENAIGAWLLLGLGCVSLTIALVVVLALMVFTPNMPISPGAAKALIVGIPTALFAAPALGYLAQDALEIARYPWQNP